MILEEFDNNRRAIINPEDLIETLPDFPELVVSCFARATFERMLMSFRHEQVATTSMANIEIPIYRIIVKGTPIALFNAPVGASACVAILEDLIAFGMKKLVLFGTCGVLDEAIKEFRLRKHLSLYLRWLFVMKEPAIIICQLLMR